MKIHRASGLGFPGPLNTARAVTHAYPRSALIDEASLDPPYLARLDVWRLCNYRVILTRARDTHRDSARPPAIILRKCRVKRAVHTHTHLYTQSLPPGASVCLVYRLRVLRLNWTRSKAAHTISHLSSSPTMLGKHRPFSKTRAKRLGVSLSRPNFRILSAR